MRNFKFVKKYYEYEAEKKPIWGDIREKVLVELISQYISRRDRIILDVGCGSGFLLNSLKKNNGAEVFGLDISHKRLLSVKDKVAGCVLIEGASEELPVKKGKFDLIVLSEVLEHLNDYTQALRELVDAAKHHVVITVPNDQKTVNIKCPNCGFEHFLDGHVNTFSVPKIKNICSNLPQVRSVKIKTFHTIFSYNRVTFKFPKFIRLSLDCFLISLSRWFSFLKPNYILVYIEKV